ncbi:hypothetical protein [Emcibacter sp. SYSU 3D8]|uniref:hypothetical protein n=1 Tax=Emcibacter sp. SYSU 3D8 TaxID=3133969 RepID=UPI0031FE56CA
METQLDLKGERLVPIPADHALIRHKVVLLPRQPEPYGTDAELVAAIREHIHGYVDLDPTFEAIAAHYVLLSWVYDAFNELPYLRLRGDYGTGKTRALLIIGSLMYRPFFASGASTVSPIFHTLEQFRGTLVLDEADFRFSDEKSDLVKILNNGTVRGMPVLRTMLNSQREFTPAAFHVFGPKLIASRMTYADVALESRFITEIMGLRPMRPDIPINLPDAARTEAAELRDKLLMYRFANRNRVRIDPQLTRPDLEARVNQVLAPLLSLIADKDLRTAILDRAGSEQRSARSSRGLSIEAHLVEAVLACMEAAPDQPLPLKDIVSTVNARYGREYDRPLTSRYVGSVLRSKLCLYAYKSHGVFIIPIKELQKVQVLAARYGISGDAEA